MGVTMKGQGVEVVKVDGFKYLGSTANQWTVYKRGEGESEGRVTWLEIVRGNLWQKKKQVRPASMYSLEMVALTKSLKTELGVEELKMLRASLLATKIDIIRNKYFR